MLPIFAKDFLERGLTGERKGLLSVQGSQAGAQWRTQA